MKKFLQFIKEELSPTEKQKVDSWEKPDSDVLAHTDHYFGEGNHVKTYPLEGTQDKSETHKATEHHLGITISPDDYKQGVAEDKYGRKAKIGGLLTRTKASQELINNFANDTTRQGKAYSGLTVHISRHPHDIAGQTSGNQSWAQESCKNFNSGSHKDYLRAEVANGTVVGYLKDHTGKEIARTTFQPHINNEGDVAYAVNSHYGIRHQGFMDEMGKVATQLSGEHKGGSILHRIHDEVYNDNKPHTILHPAISSKQLTDVLNSGASYHIKVSALNHPKITNKHINDILSSDKNGVLSSHVIRNLARDNKLTQSHIEMAMNSKHPQVTTELLSTPNALSEKQVSHLYDKHINNDLVRQYALNHDNFPKDRIDSVIDNPRKPEDLEEIATNRNLTPKHIDKLLSSNNIRARTVAASHSNASSDNLFKAINGDNYTTAETAIHNRNITPEHINHVLSGPPTPWNIRLSTNAMYSDNISKENIDKALRHPDKGVQYAALLGTKVTPEQYKFATKSPHDDVSTYAQRFLD